MVNIGIIGVGGIGSAHFNTINSGKINGMSLGAVCDVDPARLRYCRSVNPDIPVFEDYREMLKSGLVNAVLVSVPHPLHAKIGIEALQSGLHLLCEKPEDIKVSAARRLNEAAKRSGRVFGIMFNQRTDPLFQRAREIVKSGGLGEIKRSVWIVTNWYRTESYYRSGGWRATWSGEGGGVLMNQAPHNIDLWQWICGMPAEITAFLGVGKWHDIEVEDEATLYARYENGATGVFITSTGDLPGTNRLEICGTRGSLTVEQGRLTHKKLKTDERELCRTCPESRPTGDVEVEVFEPKTKGKAHAGILENFANAVNFGEKLLAPGEEGLNELMISNAAYLSAWTGSPAALPFDEAREARYDELLAQKQAASRTRPGGTQQTHEEYSEGWEVRF